MRSGSPYRRTVLGGGLGCCPQTCTEKTQSSQFLWRGAELGLVHQGEGCPSPTFRAQGPQSLSMYQLCLFVLL